MLSVAFEPTIPAFERAKTATVIGLEKVKPSL
jgi:hypothetical protein